MATVAAAITSFAVVGSAYAASPLAQFSQLPGDSGYSLSFTDGTLSTPMGGYATQFSFQNPSLPGGNLDATFTFTATGTGPATHIGNLDDLPVVGSFSFVYTGSTPLVIAGHNYGAGTTLLAGTFSGADLYGQDTGSTGSLADSRLAGGTVDFTSGISGIKFSDGDEGLSLALNSVTPYFGISGSTLANFSATSAGTFSADVTIGGGGGVPEAGTWVIMVLGFGLAGARMRVRNARLARI